jgi:hypothetical protein
MPVEAGPAYPAQLARMLLAQASAGLPNGTTVVFVAEPFLPGVTTRAHFRHRARRLTGDYAEPGRTARHLGARQLVVCSTAFLYPDDRGWPHQPRARVEPRAETVASYAADGAADVFTALGGRLVILRLG